MAKKIPDISYWQGAIDWSTAPADTDYVIIRASCGTTADSYFSRNASGAAQNGISYGVYHFLMCTNTTAAKKEAEVFYNAVKGQKIPPTLWVMDIEHPTLIWDNPATYHLNPALLAIVRAFYKRLRELAGETIKIWFYGGESVYKYAALDQIGFDGLWIANYSKKPGMSCQLWQYTSTGKWNGKSPVDLNKLVDATLDTLKGEAPATPIPSPDENGDGKVVEITEGTAWNIRQFPSAKSASVGLYAKLGEKYEWAATAWNGWLGIYLPDGNIGWISGKAGRVVDV